MNNTILLGLFLLSLMVGEQNVLLKEFQPAGGIDAMVKVNSKELKLIQLNLKNDSIFQIINNNFPALELFSGPSTYHRIIPSDKLNHIQNYMTDTDLSILNSNYTYPSQSRLYSFEVKPGSETYGTNDETEYTCACIDGASDCVKLGFDDSWYNQLDYYGEAWWAFTPPFYDSIQEIRVTVRGAQCDDFPLWSETYMGLRDEDGNWSNDYELSIDYTDNIFIVPNTWSQGMLMPTIGSEDNYVIDQIVFEFFYSCSQPNIPTSLQATDSQSCEFVNLTWELDEANTQGIELYRDNQIIFQTEDMNLLNFEDYSAIEYTEHEYCIRSYNECGYYSQMLCNAGSLNSTPSILSIEASNGEFMNQITISWGSIYNVDLYKLYRDGILISYIQPTEELLWIDQYDLQPGTTYEYCLEASNDCGPSDWTCDQGFTGASFGDANSDGDVNVADIVILVNFILLNSTPTSEQTLWLDINQDNSLNIQDVILIINIILN